MENQIPLYLEHYLQDMGVMSTEHEELDDPEIISTGTCATKRPMISMDS